MNNNMKTFNDPRKLQRWAKAQRLASRKIALVPTMGALHEGHLSLIAAAKRKGADEIVVSVFVNPTQFGPKEDYAQYPRDHKADAAKCRAAGATAIFFPTPENMYAKDHSVWMVEDGALSGCLCGARRPGHFRGVCTVVAKLFNLAHPNFAVFGQKDFQQATIIRRMVRDMNFDLEIVVAPVVRSRPVSRAARATPISRLRNVKAPSRSHVRCAKSRRRWRRGRVRGNPCRRRLGRRLRRRVCVLTTSRPWTPPRSRP